MPEVVAPLDKNELFHWLDPWTWRSRRRDPYWRLCQTAAVAGAIAGLGLAQGELVAARRPRRQNAEVLDADPREDEADGTAAARRGEYRPGPHALLDVTGARARVMPVIPAIAAVIDRSLRESPFPDAETLFTDDAGGPFDGPSVRQTIRRRAAEAGEPNLPARLRATFADTLAAHPFDDGTVEALTGLRRDRYADPLEAPPTAAQLRAAMMCHPLAPYGRIHFFEKGKPASPLLDEILALVEPRTFARKERDAVRRRHFAEAHRLWREFCFDAAQGAKFFGIKTSLFAHWAKRYEEHGHEGLADMRSSGIMTLPERTLVLSEYDEAKFPSWRAFHAHLVEEFDLPRGRYRVEALLHAEGFEPPERLRLDAEWRPKVLAAWDESPPTSYQSLHARLAVRGFPYRCRAMQEYLESEGRVVRYLGFLNDPWRAEALEAARRAQPIENVAAFHRQLKPPMSRRVFRDFLIRGGIEIARRAPKPGGARKRDAEPDPRRAG